MGETLRKWLKQTTPMPDGLDATLNLFVASRFIENDMEALLQKFGITRRQYNVLRILKGIYPEGHPRSEIAARVIEQSPDITRIIDRLSGQGLITRKRGNTDKRESLTMITPKGIALVNKVAPYMTEFSSRIEKILGKGDCKKLSALCEKLYAEKAEQ